MDPVTLAIVYAIVGVVVIPMVFAAFKTQYHFLDVVLASVASGAASLIPTFGGLASMAVMGGVLYWRIREDLFPDIVLAVFASRLATLPVLLLLRPPS